MMNKFFFRWFERLSCNDKANHRGVLSFIYAAPILSGFYRVGLKQ